MQSVLKIKNFLQAEPKASYFEVRYEDLVTKTDLTLSRVINFLELEKSVNKIPQIEVFKATSTWNSVLSVEEKELLYSKAGYLLDIFGYNS